MKYLCFQIIWFDCVSQLSFIYVLLLEEEIINGNE